MLHNLVGAVAEAQRLEARSTHSDSDRGLEGVRTHEHRTKAEGELLLRDHIVPLGDILVPHL